MTLPRTIEKPAAVNRPNAKPPASSGTAIEAIPIVAPYSPKKRRSRAPA
ncbi:hypothetical protein [Actinomadura violacea]|uniref:Uncharacterized protein n=1 Tax=Actinomadura violacea TaxID=2819934 RepID=A0ABS3RQJ9_9ACTN|nr:hypothetical protein [Actinomadura violacea]MBO2458334.1 hypothetical protein [Actinomadura violacea]